LPGCGFGVGVGSDSGIGVKLHKNKWPAVPQGTNPVTEFIPVARISDMLLSPGESYDFDGGRYTYPDIRLIYWAGGNPFHHHQDLNKLVAAFRRPETIIVNEIWSTATTRFADIVLPVTSPLERDDLCIRGEERTLVAMQQAVTAVGQSKDDFWIFRHLAKRLGTEDVFTGGKTEEEWIRDLWQGAQTSAADNGYNLPDYETFREIGVFDLPPPPDRVSAFEGFRNDPDGNKLPTRSGKIEIFCDEIGSYGYDDCPGHPVWLEPFEWLGSANAPGNALHLISNQPPDKLHSQLDMGRTAQSKKIKGREPILMNPSDAAALDLSDGAVVEVYNDRGKCLAGLRIADSVRKGVCVIATGAWFDPTLPSDPNGICKNGNPNVLTRDTGCSKLSQGPSSMTCLVQVRKVDGNIPDVTAYMALDAMEPVASTLASLPD